MQSPNSSKKYPINISLYYPVLNDKVFEDLRFIQLMNMIIKKDALNKYIYALYGDINAIKMNLFIPVFHTAYLGCQNNNVIIGSESETWLIDSFPNNKYYILEDKNNPIDCSKYNITEIKLIKDLESL